MASLPNFASDSCLEFKSLDELKTWRSFFEQFGTSVWVWDFENDRLDLPDAWLSHMGYSADDLADGAAWFALIHPDDRAQITEQSEACIHGTSELYEQEFRVLHADGRYVWFRSHFKLVTIGGAEPRSYMVGLYTDIDELQKSQNELRINERRWDHALRGSNVGVWDWNLETDEVYFSPEWIRMLEFVDEDLEPSIESWRQVALPEDLAASDRAIERYLAGETSEYRCECRVRCKDGRIKWVLDRGHIAERAADGRPVRMVGTHDDITEVKEREAEIQKNRDQLKLITSTVPGFVFQYKLMPDGSSCFPFASDGIRDLYGVAPEDVAITASPVINAIHPDDADAVLASIQHSAESGETWDQEYRSLDPQGNTHWLRGVANHQSEPDPSGATVWNGYINDITVAKRRESELRESLERLDSIAAEVPGFFYQYRRWPDGTERFPYVSEGILDVFAVTPADARHSSKLMWDRIEPRDRDRLIDAIEQSLKQGGGWSLEYRVVLPGGKTRWVKNSANRRPGGDVEEAVTWYGYIYDITKQKEEDLKFERRARAIELANEDLEQFNYVAAHDLKEPLRAIRHLSEWIEEDLGENIPESVSNNVSRLRGRVERLGRLVEDLAAYSRAGRNAAAMATVNLQNVVEELVQDIDARGCRVVVDHIPSESITTSEVSLVTVLKNLITNAAVHHDAVETGTISVRAIPYDEHIVFQVEDDGPGIAPEHHERIFKMYQRLDPDHNPTGSGSGLAIVKRTLSSVDSEIYVDSPLTDRGTRFSFAWPREWPSEA